MMKKVFFTLTLILFFSSFIQIQATTIRMSTNETDLILKVAPSGQLCQSYLGEKLNAYTDIDNLSGNYIAKYGKKKWDVYYASGWQDSFEPAFAIEHNDGNLTTVLQYVSHEVKKEDDNVTLTTILLKDSLYPVEVKLYYKTFAKENIIKTWTEIKHNEKKPVKISRYASSMLYFESNKYFMTQFTGNWGGEANMDTQELLTGKKVIETKLGTRASTQMQPFFQVGFDQPASLNQGKVLMGTLGWTGNIQFTFEVDNLGALRVISGINPYASNYELKPNEVFLTPEFMFTLSSKGTDVASRNFHSWARNYQLKDGKGDRKILYNPWEAVFFDFNEEKLEAMMKEAAYLGVDLFLLDDGWFGNKYPRSDETAGLGDWQPTKTKLPNGVPNLIKKSNENGFDFGIWVEPEMVNPLSELYEKHPEWIYTVPNRTPYTERCQLALDMTNPKVQNFCFKVIDDLMIENPKLGYLKWDCNSPITNIYSPYLKEKQNQLYIDHVRGVYNVFKKVDEKYPNLPMMLCASGGGRCDFEALKYFTDFWTSDNTDPVRRLFIQWGFSQFIPVKALSAHITNQNHYASLKFKTDVAMMCKFGFDLDTRKLSENERLYCKNTVTTYNRIKKVTLNGDMYHLVSPYDGNHVSVMYVNDSKDNAVFFAYDVFPMRNEKLVAVKLAGLDPDKKYKVVETSLMPDTESDFVSNNKVFSGDYLMKVGLDVFTTKHMNSKVLEIIAQ